MHAFIFCAVLVMHIIADFVLQGQMGLMKQKQWWIDNYPQYMGKHKPCEHDYIVVLISHSLMWSLFIMFPIIMYLDFNISNNRFLAVLVANTIIHSLVDDLKANHHMINLQLDQFLHFIQIVATFASLIPW